MFRGILRLIYIIKYKTKFMRKPAVKKEPVKATETRPKAKVSSEPTIDIQKISFELKCKNENQKKLVNLISDNVITLCSGSAGTGKTFIACGQALRLLKKDEGYTKIILVKSVTDLEGESVGYLKGSLEEKMFPYMLSFLDNFHKLIGEDNTKRMLDMGIIEVMPLAYIRGRSIDNAIIIVDEAQNITIKNMRSTLTRIGENSKMIITGDSKQVDIKDRKLSSLDTVVKMFENKNNIGTMSFTTSDIVRNPIIKMIEDEFDAWEEKQNQK